MKQLMTLTAILLLSTLSGFSQQTQEQEDLILQLSFQNPDTVKVNTSILLVKSFYDSENYDRAQDYIDEAEKLSVDLGYQKGTAELRYYKALIYTQKDDYYNALDYHSRSLAIYQQLKDSLGIAKVNNSLGAIEIRRGNYSKGLRYALSAISIFEEKDLKKELSIAYNSLAEAYTNNNQLDEALNYNLKALDVKEDINDVEGIKTCVNNIAKIYSTKKEHRKAIEYYERALTSLGANDRTIRAEILPNIGEEYLNLNNLTEAEKFIVDGLRLNRSLGNKEGLLQSLNNVADFNIRKEKVIIAQRQINEAFGLARELNNDEELLKNYKLRIDIDLLKRDYRRVVNWQTRYYELKEKIQLENTPKPIIIEDPIEEDNTIGLNEAENNTPIQDLQTEEGSNSIFKNSTYLLYTVIGVLLLLVISIILGVYKNNIKSSEIKKLSTENKSFKTENETTQKQIATLEEANLVKDRLFSIVSHDLKDSITSIKAFLDLLKEKSISKKEFDDLIPELSDNADNATALLMNLLNWSKSQMQNLDPKPESFNIQEVFKEKISLIQKKADQKRLVILDESFKDIVYADRSMVEIVIQNLLANAVKFSKMGDVITISNRHRNGHSLICIEDTGVGISKENQDKLFKNQGFTTRGTDQEKGTGLGLSICKQLVELNKGSIWVESEPNLGSRFYVELPKSEVLHDYYKNIEVHAPIFVKTPQP